MPNLQYQVLIAQLKSLVEIDREMIKELTPGPIMIWTHLKEVLKKVITGA